MRYDCVRVHQYIMPDVMGIPSPAQSGPIGVGRRLLRPSLAVQSPTRLAVPCSSKPDVTLDLGLIWTNVNMLPSGAMNRSLCEPSAEVMVPVQSALTVYVLEKCSL